ncbi:class I SAM-dependent methyltransferase [Gordonia phthalatica]|uniref:Methylase n=1 Tax=Gordonia phthalatica TaxID=1136941 RepID=A0A0N9NDJ6_9ACTN|nr:class I SAM-dependent methyltransferase [Gordonia phthalatica]ALG83616.1 methylase [Gordonia phthalatica]
MTRSGLKAGRPQGRITRGTTNINRLRRVDRAMAADPRIRAALDVERPLAVDLGYGGRPNTAVEMALRLRRAVPSLELVGLEIDPARLVEPREGVRFALGGFELAGLHPNLVRAFNVLRQYDESEVRAAWAQMQEALAPGGLIVEGTCDEIGRRCCWILLDATGPQELTLSWSPAYTQHPSELAARLPKALIHHNVAGEAIHELLTCADRCWDRAASHETYGPRDRWRYARAMMLDSGIRVTIPRGRRVDNMLSVPWELVSPN